jgi:hypothetical protein
LSNLIDKQNEQLAGKAEYTPFEIMLKTDKGERTALRFKES